MRIALIQPPIEDFYSTPQRTYPLGLTYLAASIRDLPIEIEILDLLSQHGRQTIPWPRSFKPIRDMLPYDTSPISAFHTYFHWGWSWQEIEHYFHDHHYDLCAISSNFYTYTDEVVKTTEIIKSVSPDTRVVVGGQNVGPEHDRLAHCKAIDYFIMGEGESSFRTLVQALLDDREPLNISGTLDKQSNRWMPALPHENFVLSPAADMIPAGTYRIAGKPAIMIATSRGCPMGCRFCSVSRTFGRSLRLKSVDIVLKEMQNAYARGIRAFDIEDDNFSFVQTHCIELLEQIEKAFRGSIDLYAMNGLSAEHLTPHIIDLLASSGLKLLNLSIATSSEEQLIKLHRHTHIDHFKSIARYAAETGLKVMGHFIAGLPGQDSKEILTTMKVLTEIPTILGISPFYYIPGMDLSVPNPPKEPKNARLTRFWPADSCLNELDLITLFRLSRWINYVKKELSLQKITQLPFREIGGLFSHDPFISGLLKDRLILGMNENKKLFSHRISSELIDSFFDIFDQTDVYSS